jgi:trans-aconitate methyltransferase
MPTKGHPKSVQKSYANSAKKYDPDDPNRFQWYSYSKEQMTAIWKGVVDLIPADVTKVLEVGCGAGSLATILREKRPDITYRGFDIVHKNVEDALARNPGMDITQGNFWKVLSEYKPGDWEFVISVGVLFSVTEPQHLELLFKLLDATAPRGWVVLCLGGSWGLSAEQKHTFMEAAAAHSSNVTTCYYKGKRDFLPQSITTYNSPLVMIRDAGGVTAIPVIPQELLDFTLPQDDPKAEPEEEEGSLFASE